MKLNEKTKNLNTNETKNLVHAYALFANEYPEQAALLRRILKGTYSYINDLEAENKKLIEITCNAQFPLEYAHECLQKETSTKITDHLGNEYTNVTAMCDAWDIPVTVYRARRLQKMSVKDALTAPLHESKYSKHDVETENLRRENKELKDEVNSLKERVKALKFLVSFYRNRMRHLKVTNVKFYPPVTIVYWNDGTYTKVTAGVGEKYDAEKGLAMAFVKKAFDNESCYLNEMKKAYEMANLKEIKELEKVRVAKQKERYEKRNMLLLSPSHSDFTN